MKRKGKVWVVILSVLVGLVLLIVAAVNIVLHTQVRNKLINKVASTYIDAEVNVGGVHLYLLRKLPDIYLALDNISLTYPTPADTVVGVSELRARVNVPSLMKGCFDIRDAALIGLKTNIHYSDTLMLKPQPKKEKKESGPLDLPWFKIDFTLGETDLSALDLVNHANISFKANASNSEDDVLDAALAGLCVKALGVDLDADISAKDILGNDPHVLVAIDATSVVDSLAAFFPEGISARGDLSLGVEGVLGKNSADAVAKLSSGALHAATPMGRLALRNLVVEFGADNGVHELPNRPHRTRVRTELPEFLKEEDFRKADIDVQLDSSLTDLISKWNPRGSIHVAHARVMTPMLPIRNSINGFDAHFDINELAIDSLSLRAGSSDLTLKGSLKGIRKFLTGKGFGFYKLDLIANAYRLNVNELLAALEKGSKAMADSSSVSVDDEAYMDSFVDDSLVEDEESHKLKLIVVPANVMADVKLNAKNVRYSSIDATRVRANIAVKERCVLVTDLGADTEAGKVSADAFYSTKTKENISAGFDLSLNNITADKVIDLIPAVDTLVPMLSSFKGLLNCEIAATTQLDTAFNIKTPTLNGAFRVTGNSLSLDQEGTFKTVAKILMFKDRKQGRIDSLYIGGVVTDDKVTVFPFLVALDRYALSLGGNQNFNGRFDYKVSLLRSPIFIKFGVNLKGPDFDHMRWKLTKSQFKSVNLPSFDSEVSSMLNTQESAIKNVLTSGSDHALMLGRNSIRTLSSRRMELQALETVQELSDDEIKHLEEAPADQGESKLSKVSDNMKTSAVSHASSGLAKQK